MEISAPDWVKYVWCVGTYGSKCKVSLKVHFGGANCDKRDSKNAPSQQTRTIRTIANR